jgi:hypothetical protein
MIYCRSDEQTNDLVKLFLLVENQIVDLRVVDRIMHVALLE